MRVDKKLFILKVILGFQFVFHKIYNIMILFHPAWISQSTRFVRKYKLWTRESLRIIIAHSQMQYSHLNTQKVLIQVCNIIRIESTMKCESPTCDERAHYRSSVWNNEWTRAPHAGGTPTTFQAAINWSLYKLHKIMVIITRIRHLSRSFLSWYCPHYQYQRDRDGYISCIFPGLDYRIDFAC